MDNITRSSFEDTIRLLVNADPKNNSKGEPLKKWFKSAFNCITTSVSNIYSNDVSLVDLEITDNMYETDNQKDLIDRINTVTYMGNGRSHSADQIIFG